MPTALGGATGLCSEAAAPIGSAHDAPPTTLILSRSRRLRDMSRSRSGVAVLARRFLVRRWLHFFGRSRRIFLRGLLAALEALRRRPRRADTRADKQASHTRGDTGGASMRGGNTGIGIGRSVIVNGRSFENWDLKSDTLFRAAHAGRADTDRPYIWNFIELPHRTTGVGVGTLTAQFVKAPALAVAVVTEHLREAAGIEVRTPR